MTEIESKKPAEQENELDKKQVFLSKEDSHDDMDGSAGLDLGAVELELDKRTVLDNDYAERKNRRDSFVEQSVPAAETARAPKKVISAPVRREAPAGRPRRTVDKNSRLCSGELLYEAIHNISRELLTLAVIAAAFFVILWGKSFVSEKMTNGDYSALTKSVTYSKPISSGYAEPLDPTLPSGYAAAKSMCSFFGAPIAELPEDTSDIIFPQEVHDLVEQSSNMGSKLESNMGNLEYFQRIFDNLSEGYPVIVLISNDNAPQYAIVTGMDADLDMMTLQTADGEVVYSLEQFIAASRFDNSKKLPLSVKTALLFGTLSPNTAIFVD